MSKEFRGGKRKGNHVVILFGILTLAFRTSPSVEAIDYQKRLPAKTVWGVTGKDVELPCDVTAPLPTDAVSMIFWFKDGLGMPLYSLDARGGPLDEASHLAMTDDLGSRSYFITDDHPSKARLRIQNVAPGDEGLFRCRVDFINSPTRNFQVNLTLVVQPSHPRVFDAQGKEVISDAGPFLEGHELFLSCQVGGGRPKPSLIWWHNNTILDSVIDTSKEAYTTVNQLVITNLPRSFWGNKLECRASSSPLADDLVREIFVKVYLKPTKVKIVTDNELLSVNSAHTLRCETSGSFPPAKLSWLLNGRSIKGSTEEVTDTFASSTAILKVNQEDDGKDLVCRADNPRFPSGSSEDRRQISVAYPPKVAVRLADSTLSLPLREGLNVSLKCETVARPNPHNYNWYYNGHLVAANETAGVFPIGNLLILIKITMISEGQYSCSAANSEGETYSSPFELVVQYAPRCSPGHEITQIGIVIHETIVLQCHVDSLPEVTRFSWTYNTSKGVLPVQGALVKNEGGLSTLHFTASSSDLESLSCWATNVVGRQEKPCLFFVVPANKPESPRECRLRNVSLGGGLEVTCKAGYDGGLPQSFVLEVSDVSTLSPEPPSITTLSDQGERTLPLYRVLGEAPVFRLHSLEPGRNYQLLVYAVNAKGRSEPPTTLNKIQISEDEESLVNQSHTSSESFLLGPSRNLTIMLYVLVGVAAFLIIGIISAASILVYKRRRRPVTTPVVRRRERRSKRADTEVELSEAGFNEDFRRRSAQYRASLYGQELERNARTASGPDLILSPANFSSSYEPEY